MDLTDIFSILDRFDASKATALELQLEGLHLKLEQGCGASAAAQPQPLRQAQTLEQAAPQEAAQADAVYIKAPLVGSFYAASSPEKPPLVQVGDTVKKGQSVCILEAMKMMSEITAQYDGVVAEILAENGQAVGFGAPLLRLRRA